MQVLTLFEQFLHGELHIQVDPYKNRLEIQLVQVVAFVVQLIHGDIHLLQEYAFR